MAAALSSASSLAFFQRSSFASTSGTAHNNNLPCNSKFQGTLSFNPIPGSKPASSQAHLMISAASANGVLSLEEAFQAAPKEDSRFKPVGLESYMEHVKFVNSGSEERGKFIPFVVDHIEVGYIHPSFLQHLVCFPDVFAIVGVDLEHVRFHAQYMNALHINGGGTVRPPPAALVHVNRRQAGRTESFVTLHRNLKSREDRTAAVNRALRVLSDKGIIPGWRNEFYPVVEAFGTRSLFSLERAAVPYFGVKAYAIHMNGFVQKPNGEKCLWVARRSVTKPTFPGMFDHLVAGGQPEGLSCKENVIKECDEEASIPRAISERAKAVGAVSYECIDGDRFDRFILFCYDLELPCDFRPVNKDGEVDSFTLVPVTKVARILQTTRLYKPDCALVIFDFLFRHGYISSDQSGYLELLRSLRKGDCM